jgi:hypothetical protein
MEEALLGIAKELLEELRATVQTAMMSSRWTKVYTKVLVAMLTRGGSADDAIVVAQRAADVAEARGFKLSEENMARMVALTDKMRTVNGSFDKKTN